MFRPRRLHDVVMRHKYLLRHPIGFGVIAGIATADLLKRILLRNVSPGS
jgi:hypothetical protein